MALMKSKEIPNDAVVVDEMEATTYVWDIVSHWETLSDTWALRYSPAILGSVNAMSGLLINKHYRHKLKLGTYGYLSSVIPITVMPGILTALFHRHLVSTGMLLMKNDTCPLCYEMRSAVIQWTLGIVYPMALGPASALMFANRYNTYRVPNIAEPKALFQFMKKISRPLSGTLVFLAAVQFVTSSILTYYEMRNHLVLRRKITDIENRILAESTQD